MLGICLKINEMHVESKILTEEAIETVTKLLQNNKHVNKAIDEPFSQKCTVSQLKKNISLLLISIEILVEKLNLCHVT